MYNYYLQFNIHVNFNIDNIQVPDRNLKSLRVRWFRMLLRPHPLTILSKPNEHI